MDPPPPPPPLSIPQNLPDTVAVVSSSPRYRMADNEPQPQPQPLPNVPGSKLRLMCSYGGHIMPRPHDKSLFYVGGDTRIVAVDRHSSLKDLCSHLSRTLLHGRPFTLKYHLPNEDLDNLITVSTDEDLQNMIEEYDRLASKPSPLRLRMFLFFSRPETAVSVGTLLDDANSDTWFVDALNNSGILSRVVSDSAAAVGVHCLVNLDDATASTNDLEEAQETVADAANNKQVIKHLLHVHSVEENISSCGSAYSIANLPPIRVRVDDGGSMVKQEQRLVVEQDDGFVISSSAAAATVVATGDDRKPPLPLQTVQPRTSGGFGLPSPDSVASDSSIASANSLSKTVVYYQDLVQAAHVDNKGPALPNNIKCEISDHSPGLQGEQALHQDSGYTSPQQQLDQNQQPHMHQQQQFVYIHRPIGTGQVPMSSYYPVYAPPSHQQLHHPIGQQQYPVYVMPVGSAQPYNMTLQSNIADPNMVASGRPLIPHSVVASAAYKDGTPPFYPTKLSTPTVPEVAPSVYKAPVASNTAFIQVPSNQFQQQYEGLPQNIHHPPQPIAIAPSATTNYGYEYGGPTQDQIYYTQQQAAAPPQYQSMTPAAAAAALSDVSKQFPIDNIHQPNRTSQPV